MAPELRPRTRLTRTSSPTTSDTPGASLAASNRLLRRVVYPEQAALQADTDRDVWCAYNAQGQPIWPAPQILIQWL